jgi:hypothetical protein
MLYLGALNTRNSLSGILMLKVKLLAPNSVVRLFLRIFFIYSLHPKIPSINLRLEDIQKHVLALQCEIWTLRDGNKKHRVFGTWWRLIWYVGTKPRRVGFPQFPYTWLPLLTDMRATVLSTPLTNICYSIMRQNLEDSNLPLPNICCSTRLQIPPEASSSSRLCCVLEDRRTDVWFPEGTRDSSLLDRI